MEGNEEEASIISKSKRDVEEDPEKSVQLSKKRILFIAFSVASGYFGWGLMLSLQPSFYPTVAEMKGATPSQYGFVFGIINLAALIFAPIFSEYGNAIGPKLIYNAGALLQALMGISFGFLIYCESANLFIGLSYAIRFVDGIGEAATWGSVVSILMKLFPDRVSQVMSWTETFFGLGYMLGPALGSALYMAGGFLLPFLVVGTWSLIIAVCIFFAIPSVQADDERKGKDSGDGSEIKKALNLKGVFRSGSILLPYLNNFLCICGSGMIESMLEPHMKNNAGADQVDVSNAFLIFGAFYMVFTPIIGYLCDQTKYQVLLSLAGDLAMFCSHLLIGPVPFINILPNVALIQGMVALNGIGDAAVMVSTFGRAQKAAIRIGFKDDIDTYLVCSGMWSASFFMGNFVGPTVAGIVVDAVGFRSAGLGFASIYVVTFCLDLGDLFYQMKLRKRERGYTELH